MGHHCPALLGLWKERRCPLQAAAWERVSAHSKAASFLLSVALWVNASLQYSFYPFLLLWNPSCVNTIPCVAYCGDFSYLCWQSQNDTFS